jgi:hypothetical protein
MKQSFSAAYPAWYLEGFAEYYATTRILPDNVIEIGRPADYRMASFRGKHKDWLPLDRMLTANSYQQLGSKLHLLYAQGWLLVHYLANQEERRGQLGRFLVAINQGVDPKTAMDEAFGKDAAELDRELRAYSRRLKLDAVRLAFPVIDTGSIQTRTLSETEAALIKYDLALSRGILASYAGAFAAGAQKIAAGVPEDPYALGIVTEAEYAAGNFEAARKAAGRWLSLQPGSPRALMFSGLIDCASLAKASSRDAQAWAIARAKVADALDAGAADPMIMEAYYDSYALQGVLPPARAQNSLYRAMELVPQDDRLRYKVAADFERRNLVQAAIQAIRPSALRTHVPANEDEEDKAKREQLMQALRRAGDTRTETPVEMLARLEQKMAAGVGTPPQNASAVGRSTSN